MTSNQAPKRRSGFDRSRQELLDRIKYLQNQLTTKHYQLDEAKRIFRFYANKDEAWAIAALLSLDLLEED